MFFFATRSFVVLSAAVTLSACSVLQEDKIDYKSATVGPGLEVPPDLSQLRRDSRYALESTSASASGHAQAQRTVKDAGTATNQLADVRMERSGQQRWLVVNRSADQVWGQLREFWTSNGFVLNTDAPELGIMETDWAENRAKIPQDFIRRSIGKLFDGLYSSGERDRYRTRLERHSAGGVEIYISHRGMVEEYTDTQKSSTVWKPRASDPELEIEFLRRLMVKLGGGQEQAAAATAASTSSVSNTVVVDATSNALTLSEPLDRAWRRTGLALDRSGLTVEDRDRSKGIYHVRYAPSAQNEDKPGFLSRLFSKPSQTSEATRYQIVLQAAPADATRLQVLNAQGAAERSDNARKILELLAKELR